MDYKNTHVLALAFMGDAVYEQFIREKILKGELNLKSREEKLEQIVTAQERENERAEGMVGGQNDAPQPADPKPQRYALGRSVLSRPDLMHRVSVSYVKANAQCEAIKRIFVNLTPEEQDLVKRARNHKIATKPKNADAADYKWATAFEALLGYLYLSGQTARLNEIMEKSL